MAAVRRSCTGSRHSARAQASALSLGRPGWERAVSVTAWRMPGTLTPRKSRSLLRYRFSCAARVASASGSISPATRAAAASASKVSLITCSRYPRTFCAVMIQRDAVMIQRD